MISLSTVDLNTKSPHTVFINKHSLHLRHQNETMAQTFVMMIRIMEMFVFQITIFQMGYDTELNNKFKTQLHFSASSAHQTVKSHFIF